MKIEDKQLCERCEINCELFIEVINIDSGKTFHIGSELLALKHSGKLTPYTIRKLCKKLVYSS